VSKDGLSPLFIRQRVHRGTKGSGELPIGLLRTFRKRGIPINVIFRNSRPSAGLTRSSRVSRNRPRLCHPRPNVASATLPAMKNAKAAPIRTGQPNSILKHLWKSHSVAGQSDSPENNANHPLVSGQGPRAIISSRPPPPATSAHTQANTTQRIDKYRATPRVR